MRTVKIPDCMNPFVVVVNHVEYAYPAGETVEVPDEVAYVIEQHQAYHDFIESSNSGGGGGGSSEPVDYLTQQAAMTVYKNETITSLENRSFEGCTNLRVLDFTNLEYGWHGIRFGDAGGDSMYYDWVPSPLPTYVQALVNRGGLFQAGHKDINDCENPDEDVWVSNIGFCKNLYIYVPREYIVEKNFYGSSDDEGYSIYPYGADWESWWRWNKIRAIEDYTVDGTVTGALDLAKMGIE